MKKRKQRLQQKSNHDPILFEINNISDINGSQMHNKSISIDYLSLEKQSKKKVQHQEKTCFEWFKQKVFYYLLLLVNYLQYDRLLTKSQIINLKQQDFIIKSKYPQYYDQTYQQRQKKLQYTLDDILRRKKQQQEKKNKTFWSQFKRFICCEGGNQMQQADELLTAADQSQYFYLTKTKQKGHMRLPNQTFNTQHEVQEKPFSKMIRQQSNSKQIENIFMEQEDQIIFDDQIDDIKIAQNNKKNIKKDQLTNNQSLKRAGKDDLKMNPSKDIKNTQEILVKKNNQQVERFQDLDEKLTNNKNNKKDKISEQGISDLNEMDTYLLNSQTFDKNNQKNIEKNGINNSIHTNDKTRQSKNTSMNKFQIDQQNTNMVNKKNSFNINKSNTIDFDSLNNNKKQSLNSSRLSENSEALSAINSQNLYPEHNTSVMAKKNTKKKRRQIKKTIENTEDSGNDDFIVTFGDQEIKEDQSENEDKIHKKYSLSSKQLDSKKKNRKLRNRNRNNDSFNDQLFNQPIIFEGKDEEQNKQREFNTKPFFAQKDSLSNAGTQTISQNAKKKKARAKKFQHFMKEEQFGAQQIIVFGEEDQTKIADKSDIQNSNSLASEGVSKTANLKKRKRNKQLKNLNEDQNHEIVLQANEIMEQENKKDFSKNNNFTNNQSIGMQNSQSQMGMLKIQKKRKKKSKLKQQMEKNDIQEFDLGQMN